MDGVLFPETLIGGWTVLCIATDVRVYLLDLFGGISLVAEEKFKCGNLMEARDYYREAICSLALDRRGRC